MVARRLTEHDIAPDRAEAPDLFYILHPTARADIAEGTDGQWRAFLRQIHHGLFDAGVFFQDEMRRRGDVGDPGQCHAVACGLLLLVEISENAEQGDMPLKGKMTTAATIAAVTPRFKAPTLKAVAARAPQSVTPYPIEPALFLRVLGPQKVRGREYSDDLTDWHKL